MASTLAKARFMLLSITVVVVATTMATAFRVPPSFAHRYNPARGHDWGHQHHHHAQPAKWQAYPNSLLGHRHQAAMRSESCSSRQGRRPPLSRLLRMSLPTEGAPTSRGRAIGVALSGWIAGLTLASGEGQAISPIKKTQELLRIWGQEEADNALRGELASPEGGKTIQPVLALIPVVTLRLQLGEVEHYLKDPRKFGEALAILQADEFEKKSIKRAFNTYSDNIYYLPNSDRENKYLQGGASPSTRQTLQYLLRNDVIDNVEALTAEIAYLIREREALVEGSAGTGSTEADLDETDLKMYLAKCQNGFDRYLGMVYQNEIDEATQYAKMALVARKNRNSPSEKLE